MKDTNTFIWDDPFLLDELLTEEEGMIRENAYAYTQERLTPRAEHAFLAEETDPEIFREMGELDPLGVTIPEQYSGIGAGCQATGHRHTCHGSDVVRVQDLVYGRLGYPKIIRIDNRSEFISPAGESGSMAN